MVISFQQQDWSSALTEDIINRNPDIQFISINRKDSFFSTLLSKLIHKLAIILNPYFKASLRIAAYAHHDKTHQLLSVLRKKVKQSNIERVLAHNLGAFYPAFSYAKQHHIPLQFDVEDYHPGELPYFNQKHEIDNRLLLMKTMLMQSRHITYAAPLIMEACLALVNHHPSIASKSTVINNCFSKEEFKFHEVKSSKIKLVWFSQNITSGRGLELLLPILARFEHQIELHLIGNLYPDFEAKYIRPNKSFISVHPPMTQTALNLMLSEFDVGLALEVHTKDTNRQICLTNKIWAYMQSGLYIFATNTPAQKEFLEDHSASGQLINNTTALEVDVRYLIDNITKIRKDKTNRYQYAQQFSWEIEQYKLKKILHE